MLSDLIFSRATQMQKENSKVSKLPAPLPPKSSVLNESNKRKFDASIDSSTISSKISDAKTKREIAPVRKPAAAKTRVGTVGGKTAVTKTVSKPTARSTTSLNVKKPTTSAAAKPLMPPKKRPAYDVKGRLLDLEQHYQETNSKLGESTQLIQTMTSKLDKSESTIHELIDFKAGLEKQVIKKEVEVIEMEKELELLRSQKNSSQQELRTEIENLKKEYGDEKLEFESKIKLLSKEMEDLKIELQSSKSEIVTYKVFLTN